jgi:hypothetical protein
VDTIEKTRVDIVSKQNKIAHLKRENDILRNRLANKNKTTTQTQQSLKSKASNIQPIQTDTPLSSTTTTTHSSQPMELQHQPQPQQDQRQDLGVKETNAIASNDDIDLKKFVTVIDNTLFDSLLEGQPGDLVLNDPIDLSTNGNAVVNYLGDHDESPWSITPYDSDVESTFSRPASPTLFPPFNAQTTTRTKPTSEGKKNNFGS